MTAREIVYKILSDTSSYSKGVNEAASALEEFKKKNKDVGEILAKVSKQAAIMTTALAAAGIACGKLAVDFNKGFSQVQTLIPGNTERIKELQKSILDLSPAVGKTTSDLTNGLYQVVSAFGDSAEAVDQLTVSAKAATAGAATTNDAVNLLSAVTKGYGDTSADAQQKVSDLAFVAVKLGQTTFPELSTSIQRVTSLSNTLGVTQEELFSVFSASTGVIGGASEVSTKLAATYNELLKPQDALQKAFKSLGVVTGNELIQKFAGLTGALDALKGYADSAGIPVSNLFGSIEAGQLALYATGAGAEKLSSDLASMTQAAGATEEAFNAATSGGVNAFGFQLDQAKLNAQAFAIKLGQELIPQIQELLTPVFDAAKGLANLDKETLQTIVSAGKILITFTSATAVAFNLAKGIVAVKTAMTALSIAAAANPIGIIAAVSVTAAVALGELVKRTEQARLEKVKLETQAVTTAAVTAKETAEAVKLSKEYEYLSKQENLSVAEKTRLKIITEQLKTAFPALSGVYDENTGSLKLNREELERLNEEKLKEIQADKNRVARLLTTSQTIRLENKKTLENLKEESKRILNDDSISQDERMSLKHFNDVKINLTNKTISDLEIKITAYKESIKSFDSTLAELKSFNPAENTSTDGDSSGANARDLEKSQGARLKALDDAFQNEKQLIEQRGGDIVEAEKEHFEKRKKLLEDFNREDLEKGMSLEQSNKSDLAGSAGTIEIERADTIAKLSQIETEANQKRLAETSQIAEKTEASINHEIELRKSLGLIEGDSKAEIERNALIEKGNALKEKQKSLIDEYNRLMDSGKEADAQRAETLKGEINELGKSAQNAFDDAEKTSASVWDKVASGASEAASTIQGAFSGLKDLFTGISSNKAEIEAREHTQKLTEIEKEKNAAILELDRELDDLRYEQQQENKERDEAEKEESYQKTIEEYNRSLNDLQTSFDAETNIKNLREIEAKLEETRKKKAEEVQRKKEETEKKKREEQQRKDEVALLNAKQEREHQFSVAQIQTENEAGAAKAKAAQEQAKWEKASTVLSLGLQAAMMTVKAATSYPVVPSMVAYGVAAGLATAQAVVAAMLPGPSDYSPQSLPASPSPIKFATGGIALPQTRGTPFSLPGGYPAIAAEAGIPEMIMPLTSPNIESFIKAAIPSMPTATGFNYAPVFQFHIPYTENTDPQQVFDYIKDHCARDLFDVVEEAKRKWYLGA